MSDVSGMSHVMAMALAKTIRIDSHQRHPRIDEHEMTKEVIVGSTLDESQSGQS
jgi:hypothetical protein